jgi:peptide/nickel transport system substrate-binding protein
MTLTRQQTGSPGVDHSRLSRRRLIQTAALAAGGTFAGLSRTDAWAQVDASTLVIADNLPVIWRTLDPAVFYEGNPSAAMYLLYETLYHAPDAENPNDIQPMLALDMPVFSDDRLTATISLREDVTFHNSGNRLTAADVIFSWNRLKNTGLFGSYLASDYWTAVEAPDDYTLVLTLPSPNANLAAVLVAPMLSITEKAAVEALGGTDAEPSSEEDSPEVLANLAAKEEIDRASVGSGPFRLVQWDVNNEIILERVDAYWADVPAIERVLWRNTLDVNAQLQSVQIGEADIASQVNVEALATLGDDVAILQGRTFALQYLAMNLREDAGGVVAIQEVRQALAHAIDYQGIIDGLLLGNGVRPATAVPLPLEGSEAALHLAIPTDLARAQQLWNASGVGEATIQLDYASDSIGRGGVNFQSLATKLQADVERIDGLTIRLAPMPSAQRSARQRSGEFQMTIGNWSPDFPGVDSFITPFFRTDASVARRSAYSDPEVDLLIDQANAEMDAAVREELYVEIQRRAIDACPVIVLYQPDDIIVAGLQVHGVHVHPVYKLQLRNASKSE